MPMRCLMIAASLLALPAAAQDYPAKPVRLIVPYAPGGSSDILARLFGQKLTEAMGQTFVVDNRPGAGGMIGTAILARAPGDGHTLILQDMPHTINPAVHDKVPYDPVTDFTPITLIARAPQWLFVHPEIPARTVMELVKLAKAQPGKLKIGSAGNGSGTHLMAELLIRGAGIQLTHVPYKGAGPAVAGTVAGEINAVFTSMPAAVAFVQSGRLRPIGITAPQRSSAQPEVPTFAESGIAGMTLFHWFGVMAPAKLAKPRLERLNAELKTAVNSPAVGERFRTMSIEPATTTPEEFQALIKSDLQRWGKVVREAGIKSL